MEQISLKAIKREKIFSEFLEVYYGLIRGQKLEQNVLQNMLQIAIIFINCEDKCVSQLGYRIVLQYSLQENDYDALHELALNFGFIPIAKLSESKKTSDEDSGLSEILSGVYKEMHKADDDKYLTKGQKHFKLEMKDLNKYKSQVVIAPTSYGKSDAIIEALGGDNKNCILVPTKALLAQTKKRVLQANFDLKEKHVITHQEMYSEDRKSVVAILTQERFMALLQEYPTAIFDNIFVDEAHNLLEKGIRSNLLGASLMISKKRNPNITVSFFTPFLNSVESLDFKYSEFSGRELRKNEYIKSEKVFICDFRTLRDQTPKLYDQFLDKFIPVDNLKYKNYIDLAVNEATNKNIIYFNTPKQVESYARELLHKLPEIESSYLDKACDSIKKYIHEDYFLLKCIKHGIIYHHGSMPDNVKLYIEQLYKSSKEIRFIITTSTLLEGVNIPAEQIFIFSTKKGLRNLSSSQLKNLIGRVARFSDIFGEKDETKLNLLMPRVFLIGTEYVGVRANLENFLSERLSVAKEQTDMIENVLLKNSKNKDEKTEKAFTQLIENIEPNTIPGLNISKPTTSFGKSCFKNRIVEFDVIKAENKGQAKAEALLYAKRIAGNVHELLDLIYELFIKPFEHSYNEDSGEDEADDYVFYSLDNPNTRNRYALHFQWKSEGTSFSQMISSMRYHWNNSHESGFVYVGKWGDAAKNFFWKSKNYTNIFKKTDYQLNNIAIVRIKDEQDFIEHALSKFVEILNDLNLIEPRFYIKLKYGTDDPEKIVLINNGLSSSLASLLLKKYKNKIKINIKDNGLEIDEDTQGIMEKNGENLILINEVTYHLK